MKSNKWHDTIIVQVTILIIYVFVKQMVFLYVALGLCFMAIFIPSLGKSIHRLWFLMAELLGAIFGKILLTLIYILSVLPLALIFKKKLSLNLKLRSDTYFKNRDHQFTGKDTQNPW